MKKYTKTIITTALLLTLPLISACNTMEGFGEDVTNTGQAIEDTAD